MKPTNEKRLSCVRTVVDVEEGSVVTPVSPPATEQDRAEFQRLLNGLSTGGKDGTVSKIEMSGEVSTQEPSNAPGKAGVISDSDSVKPSQKTKKKRGGKKSNKSSPTDSPKRTTGVEGNEQPEDNVLASKKDQQLTAQKNESQAPNSLSGTSLPMPKEPSDHVRSSKSSKVFQNVKVARQVMQNTQGIERLELDENKRNPTKPGEFMKKSLKDSKDLNEANCVLQDRSLVKLEHCTSHSSKGDPEVVDSVFKRQPLLLLRAAVNLIRPEKKIQSLKDLNFFYCSVCDREFPDLDKHVEKSRDHLSRWKCKMRQQTVAMLPDLSSKHISLLDNLVATTVKKCEISEEQYLKAQTLWTDLDALARKSFKGCSVRWFGSHANRIAMCDSVMLNMDFLVQSKEDAATTFLKFISAVEENFKTVDRVVATNFAHAHIHHNEFVVQLSLNNNGAFNLSKLIQEYINIDKRVQPLCQFFRYWGKICRVDQGENGSWQGHAFPIMVIHFLQQKLVLPVLHDMVENPDKNPEIYLDPRNLPGQWSCQNGDSVGLLLFQMFSYYAVEHDVGKHVVCITQKKPYLRSATKWNAKRIAVMDPFLQKHNISRYVSASMYDYIHYCLVSTACALGIPRTNLGPLFGYIARRPNPSFFEQTPDVLKEYLDVTETIFELVLRVDSSYNMPDLRRNNEEQAPKLAASLRNSAVYRELMKPLRVVPRVTDKCQVHPPPENAYAFWWVTPYQAAKLTSQVNQDLLQVTLTKYMCTDNEVPPVICTSCHKSGHLRTDCPDEIIPKMNAVLPPSKDLNAILDKLCLSIFETQCSEESGVRDRFEICQDIHGFLRHFWRPDIELHLFGSSLNGFGGRSSDIDICLTFRSNADGEGLNFPAIVEEIQMSLRGHKNIHQPQAITTAKVPIVKFLYGRNNIQVDISLYNRLGMMNTQLLRTYSVIDQRVRPLVYMMKSLAKATGIGDASRGSLSSYAYSLMSLFFLQQVEPPVIPVLQELYDPSVKRNEEIMDGANVYFFQNLEKLSEVWPHGGANKSTLGELWLQLLEFYASDIFHNSQQVVCIRKKAPLFKFDKLWTSTNICIEDPFDLNHNLGSGLSKRMNIFIVRTFQKACKHFSSLPNVLLTRPMALEDYYFNEDSLSVGKPPSDRGCHYCRSIGHVQNDCPSRRLMMQQRQAAVRLRGRQNRGNIVRQAPHDFERSNRGGRREYVQDPRSHDPGRISNMPMPMRAPLPVQSGAPGVYAVRKPTNSTTINSSKLNVQNHIVVGSTKPPGYPSIPPRFPSLGHPIRAPPVLSMPAMPPPLIQGVAPPPFLMARPTVPDQPFTW